GSGRLRMCAELLQHSGHRVPRWCCAVRQESGMTGPGISRQLTQRGHDARAKGIEMDVANKFEQIALPVNEHRLEAVLEKVPRAPITSIEHDGVSGEQTVHKPRQRNLARAQEQMKVVRHQAPSVHRSSGIEDHDAQALNEALAVAVAAEEQALF